MNVLDHRAHVSLPRDPQLPGLGSLLDAGRLAKLLPGLFPDDQVTRCHPLYVRYKPETNAVAAWVVELADQPGSWIIHGKAHSLEHFATACEKAEASRWLEPEIGRPFCAVPDQGLLLFSFPNDLALSGLRLATNPKKMQRALYAHVTSHPESEWRLSDRRMVITPIRFKPEKRAVLRIDTKAVNRRSGEKQVFRIYARVSNNPQAQQVAELMKLLHGELVGHPYLRTPPSIAYLAESGVTLVPDAGGQELIADQAGVKTAGRALAALHDLKSANVPPREFDSIVGAALDNTGTMSNLMPELAGEIKELSESLQSMAENLNGASPTLVHGDFHPEQLLVRGEEIILLDFDRSYAGDPGADLGNYCAHLIYRKLTCQGSDPYELIPLFAEEYVQAGGARPDPVALAFWTALGLLNLAPAPFRSLDPNWPQLTLGLLAACRRELACI